MKKERDLFSIGEVARALNITRRAILYYEEFGLIRPDVKDGATGNRYYTIDTFVKLRTIRILQNLGLSLSDVLGYFDGDFALAPLIRRLEAQRDELDRHIESLRERSGAEPPQVKLIRLLPQTVYRRVCAAATVAERTTLLRSTALEGMRLYGTDISHRMYLVESPIDKPDQVAFCVAIPPESRGEYVEILPAAPALSLYHHGAYEQLPAVVKQLLTSAWNRDLRLRARSAAFIWRARPSTRTTQSSSHRYFCRCWSGRGRSTASPPRQNSSHRIPVGCRAPGA